MCINKSGWYLIGLAVWNFKLQHVMRTNMESNKISHNLHEKQIFPQDSSCKITILTEKHEIARHIINEASSFYQGGHKNLI